MSATSEGTVLRTQSGLIRQGLGEGGFSLIEILVGLTLLAIAGTFVAGKIFDQLEDGKVSATKIQMNSLSENLKEFRRHCGQYPTTEQGLEALVSKPTTGRDCPRYPPNAVIDAVPKDPWDNDYIYESDGKNFNIISYGNDGAEGGDGYGVDISFRAAKSGGSGASAGGAAPEDQPSDDGGNNGADEQNQ